MDAILVQVNFNMAKSIKTGIRSLKALIRTHHEKIRRFLAWLAAIVLVGIGVYVFGWELYTSGSHYVFDDKPFNELTKAAVDIRLEHTGNMFQIGIAILAALWGLLFVRKEEAILVFEDAPELTMSVCATILLLLSIVCHLFYTDIIMDSYISARDVAAQKTNQQILKNENEKAVLKAILDEKDKDRQYEKLQALVFGKAISDDDCGKKNEDTMPDVFDPGINYLFVAQRAFLIAGILNAILTFVSAHKLKPATK